MHGAQAGNRRLILNRHMSGQLRAVRDDHVVADVAVMREVHVAHEETVATDARRDRVRGTAIDRRVLANRRVVADVDPRFFTTIFEILRITTEDCPNADLHALTDPYVAFQCGARGDLRAVANGALGTDDRPRPDVDLVAELRRCIDQCRGMNARSHRSRTIADMSASVTT